MTATLVERLGALGDLTLTHTWDPLLYKLLRKDALLRIWKGEKVYAASIVTRRGGDARTGITIGGRDPRTLLGHDNWGPVIERREFIAGTTRLSNGDFAMLDPVIPTHALFWTFTEGTSWRAGGGLVTLNPAVRPVKDDVLLAQEQPPALAGQQWEARAADVAWPSPGTHPEGKLRLRLIWFGHFDNPELWTNGSLAAGSTGWTMDAPVSIVHDPPNARTGDYVMVCGTIPKPQLVEDPGFETGTGWTDHSDAPGDMAIVNDPPNALSGSYVLRAGPITQKQDVLNPTFDGSIAHWYQNNDVSDPSTDWYLDSGQGMDGSDAMTTAGVAGAPNQKFLRAQFDSAPGVTPATVVPGEEYEIEGFVWAAPGTDGRIFCYGHIPHPTLANHERWYEASAIEGSGVSSAAANWKRLNQVVSIAAARTKLNLGITVIDHHAGYWHIDNFTLTRTRGNRGKMTSDLDYAVVPGSHYQVAAALRCADDLQVGNARVGITLTGAGLLDMDAGTDQGSTDFVWVPVTDDVTPGTGYVRARPYVSALDIIGAPVLVDSFTLTKMDNNTATATGTTFLVTPERTEKVRCYVRSGPNLQRGDVRLSMRCRSSDSPGRPEVVIESSPMPNTGDAWKEVTVDLTTPSGYDLVDPRVIFTDVEGDVFRAGEFSVVDADGTTRVIDFVASATGDLTIGATAPAGTEKVGVALVAEAGGYSWQAGSVVLHRIGEPIPTAAEVVDALLHDPVSGEYLLLPGNIVGSDTLRHDWLIEWQSLRANLIHLSTAGVVEPLREDRVRIDDDGDLRYDWGTADQLYQDRGALVLTNSQPIVVDGVSVDENTEAQVERVVVIGATKADSKGRPVQIIGVASNDPTGGDWRSNPVTRTLVVTDASAETVAYANSLARFHLDRAAVSVVNTSATLANWEATSAFDVGDWVHPENRDAGLEDGTAAVELGGETIYPARERVVGRTTRMGQEEFRAEVLDSSTGEWVPLPGVGWEKATTAQVELGTVRPDFIADPQNGSAITQFNEFALSNGR